MFRGLEYQTGLTCPHLATASTRFVSANILKDEKINVAFVPFPDSLYRVVREEG